MTFLKKHGRLAVDFFHFEKKMFLHCYMLILHRFLHHCNIYFYNIQITIVKSSDEVVM